jgi:hypothetical protein
MHYHIYLIFWCLYWAAAPFVVSGTVDSGNSGHNGVLIGQVFLREPGDQTAIEGTHVTLPCRVQNLRGMLQWTRDGFGLGVERNLTGFERYHMTGSDEEGKIHHQQY